MYKHPMTKRALLIAFHFPPQAASSGIQRTLSFSRHLGRYGWEPMVLSAHPRAYNQQNPSQLASVPPELLVRRAFALDSKHHMGIKGRYPELLALPDRWISWWLGAVPQGLAMIRRHRPQVIWSTFPVATAHLIGLTLHRLTGLPWIADFRDPMLQPSHPTSRMQRKLYGWIEHQTIMRCHTAVFTTHGAMNSYRTRFPQLPASKFVVIENGYDEDGFAPGGDQRPPAVARAERPVTLVHSGVLYQTGRDPSTLFEALARLRDAGAIDAQSLRVVLRAPGDVDAVRKLAQRLTVADIVDVREPVPYREALNEMLDADGLIVFQGTPFNNQIPAKVYEYFRARKPILGLVDPAGETANVLRAAGFDSVVDMNNVDQVMSAITLFISQARDGQAHVASEALVAASSRVHRAGQLAQLFDSAGSP